MKSNFFLFLKNVDIRNILVIIFLFGLWVFLTLLYIFNYNLSLSVISYSHSKDNFDNFTNQRLFAGDKVNGEFVAEENYLGILSIGFSTFEQVPYEEEDILIFRLREEGSETWYYENIYRSGLIYEVPFLPFGFPPIENSKGKTYEFEIESRRGNIVNAVALSSWEPVIVSRYQIPREQLTEDKEYLASFIAQKIIVSLSNREVLFFSLIYSLPFLFYLLFFIPPGKDILTPVVLESVQDVAGRFGSIKIFGYEINIQKSGGYLRYILIAVVLINIFIIPTLNDLALVVVGALWFILLKYKNYDYRVTFLVGVGFLLIAPIMLSFNLDEIAEKAAVWAYTFFVVGAIQIFLYIRKSEKKNTIKTKKRKQKR